jgi:UDP-glucose 4-epimerase
VRAVVTGGAGFVGSNLVDRLVADGWSVTVLDDLSTGSSENLAPALNAGAELVEMDVAEPGAAASVINLVKPEAVFHLAARASVGASVADPREDARVNVMGTLSVLGAAVDAEVKRLIYVSTGGAVYGDVSQYPTPESATIAPESPYGTSKYAAEMYCKTFSRLHGISTMTLRLANVYGPRQDALGEGGVVAIFAKALVEGLHATVNGDGLQTRDFVMVDDVVEACIKAWGSDFQGACNIATGIETNVLELISGLEAAGARSLSFSHGPARDGEVRRSLLDPSLAAEALGWAAEVDFVDGLKRTLDWQIGA